MFRLRNVYRTDQADRDPNNRFPD